MNIYSTVNYFTRKNRHGKQVKGKVEYKDREHKSFALRKHAYSNILKILQLKKENFHIKNSDIFSYF